MGFINQLITGGHHLVWTIVSIDTGVVHVGLSMSGPKSWWITIQTHRNSQMLRIKPIKQSFMKYSWNHWTNKSSILPHQSTRSTSKSSRHIRHGRRFWLFTCARAKWICAPPARCKQRWSSNLHRIHNRYQHGLLIWIHNSYILHRNLIKYPGSFQLDHEKSFRNIPGIVKADSSCYGWFAGVFVEPATAISSQPNKPLACCIEKMI